MARREKITFHGIELYIESPEDLLANKLFFGSHQDIQDAQSVFIRQRQVLDMDYLEFACRENGVLSKLQQILQAIEEEASVKNTDGGMRY